MEHNLTQLESNILLVLDGKELSGIQIYKHLKVDYSYISIWGVISLYAPLYKLEKHSFIESRWGSNYQTNRGNMRIRYYSITPLGLSVSNTNSTFGVRLNTLITE
jgi:DNA-binding PadR family transcriptional regulator